MYKLKAAEWKPQHFKWEVKDRVATVSLNGRAQEPVYDGELRGVARHLPQAAIRR